LHLSHFSARVLNKLRWIYSFNGAVTIGINKKKFIIPLLGRQGYENLDLSEPWMTKVLLALRGIFNGHFVDVGVNIGQTLLKAYAVFDQLNYIGFEPNPACVNYVQELVRLNGLKNTVLLPIAIGAKTEMLRLNFFASDKSDSSATIIENFKQNTAPDHFIFVPVYDSSLVSPYLPEKPYSILKIDVEGAEMEVLTGLADWINKFYPVILLEILPVYSAENKTRLDRQDKIEELLRSLNYKIARIKKKEPLELAWIDTFGIHSNIEDCDYLLYHESLKEKISASFNNP
jgi:FkbM family methyltransferase